MKNNGIKNLAGVLVAIVIFIVLLNSVFNNSNSKMTYSELITSISEGKVKEIVLSAEGTEAEVELTEMNTPKKRVVIPSVDNLLEIINESMVNGEEIIVSQEEESIFVTILSIFSPFVIHL